ncbi:GABA permease [Cordyceps militaris]|uniref:GABA permease n=1 Tax=Cordyceps militaris TaxID=73501 RepID=A0A2H4ST88_CORMI|nr:GABA permease [Cordyceps militaris]
MSLAEKGDRSSLATSEVPPVEGTPAIKKRFNFWTAFGVAVCTSGAWEGWTASIAQGLAGGGPVCLLWGWLIVSVGIICMACALAEFSWATAWLGVAGLWLGALSCGMGVAVQIQSYVIVTTDYDPKTWHAFLICIACMLCWAAVNIFSVQFLHYMNTAILVLHVVGYLVVIGVLAGYKKEKHDAAFVFTNFQNRTGWDSDFVAWSVGLLSALYAYFSLDTVTHFSEEIPRANVVVPRAMILQAGATALMTLPFIITVLFCIGDIDEVLASPIGVMSPFTQILINSTSNVGLSCFLNCISSVVAMTAGFDLWGAAARAIWSMARDQALPGAFAKLHPRLDVPVLANLVLLLPSVAVFMIYIWNTTAFYGIMAGVLVAFQLSYVLPIGINIFYAAWWRPDLVKGPFNMGRISLPVHIIAFFFGCYMVLFMSFPVYNPVTAANMNYASSIIGATLIFAIVLWLVYGRKRYYGPLEFTAMEVGQIDAIVSKAAQS